MYNTTSNMNSFRFGIFSQTMTYEITILAVNPTGNKENPFLIWFVKTAEFSSKVIECLINI